MLGKIPKASGLESRFFSLWDFLKNPKIWGFLKILKKKWNLWGFFRILTTLVYIYNLCRSQIHHQIFYETGLARLSDNTRFVNILITAQPVLKRIKARARLGTLLKTTKKKKEKEAPKAVFEISSVSLKIWPIQVYLRSEFATSSTSIWLRRQLYFGVKRPPWAVKYC